MTALDESIGTSAAGPLGLLGTVNLIAGEEETDLRAALRSMLTAAGDIEDIRRTTATEPGYSTDLWRELTESMAVTSMAVPESEGGLGYGLGLLTAVLEECGRALRPEPVLTTAAIGVPALAAGTGDRATALRDRALAGELLVAASALTAEADRLTATPGENPDTWQVTGTSGHIAAGATAEVFVVTAQTPTGRRLFAVPAAGVTVTAHESIDPTRPIAGIDCHDAEAIALTEPADTDTDTVITDLHNRALIALAAEQVGICDRLLEMTREYTMSRKQFGRQIASYQAIKHRIADLLLDLERARSATRYAAAHYDTDPTTASLAAAIAAAVATDAAQHLATDTIQLHGGIGFTWEHPAHNYYRRVLTDETLYGNATAHRRRIAELLGLTA